METNLALKELYDRAFTAVNPSTVFNGFGTRFPEHYDTPWRASVHNSMPVHYPDSVAVAGLPNNVYPIVSDLGTKDMMKPTTHADAAIPPVIDPLTVRYQNMPENPNAAVLMKGAIMADG
jgi:hypothetical protein